MYVCMFTINVMLSMSVKNLMG